MTASATGAQQPAIAVVELGTNNCTLNGVCTDLQARIDQLMAMLDSVEVVLWLNVQEDVPLTPTPSSSTPSSNERPRVGRR